jgi:hypothetical protein
MEKIKSIFSKYGVTLSIIIIVLILSTVAFVYGTKRWCISNSGEFGSLLAGTIGVGASISAMVAVIATLREQQKVNDRKDLVTAFDDSSESFFQIIHRKSEYDEKKSIEESLEMLWGTDEDKNDNDKIQPNLNIINTHDIGEDTYNSIHNLNRFCNNKDLKKTVKYLNRLLSIRNKALDLNSESTKRILADWDIIEYKWKKYAGFYFTWNTLDPEKVDKINYNDDLIKSFLDNNCTGIGTPKDIPIIKIENKETNFPISELNNDNEKILFIVSKCTYPLSIYKATIVFVDHKHRQIIADGINIVLIVSENQNFESSYSYSLKEIFGHKLNELTRLIQDTVNSSTTVATNFDLHLKYKGNVHWIYSGKLIFDIFANNNEKEIRIKYENIQSNNDN